MLNRKHLSLKVLGLILVFIFAMGTGQAAEFGARAYGMGGAFTGIAKELPSMIYNPARLSDSAFLVGVGLGASDFSEVTSFHKLLDDPSKFDESIRLGVVSLSGIAIAGIGGGLAVDGNLEVDAGCANGLCAEGEYMSQVLLSMGRKVTSLPLLNLHVGGTFKRLDGRRIDYENSARLVVSETDPYVVRMEDWKGEGYSFTLGAAMALTDMITIGVAASDVFSNVTWTGTETETNYTYDPINEEPVGTDTVKDLGKKSEKLEAVYRAGVSFKPPVLGLTLAADLASDGSVRYGLEKNLLLNLISLRAGQIIADDVTTTTVGLGINFGPTHIDAAVGSSDGFETFNSMIEASVRF